MKSESKKFEPKQKKKWLITYEVYRVLQSMTAKADVGSKVIEADSLEKAIDSLRLENHKIIIIYHAEL